MPRRPARRVRGLSNRIQSLLVLTVAGALLVALACLHLVGEPPELFRVDALWVNDHIREARTFVYAGLLALAASVPPFLLRRQRALVVLLWLAAIAMTVVLFADRAAIIVRVAIGQLG